MTVVSIVAGRNGVVHAGQMQSPDWRRIKPEDLHTPDECAQAMTQIDDIIGAIDTQLRQACADFNERGIKSDIEWMIAAQHALKKFKIKRQAVQDRKGALSRELKKASADANNNSWPQRFVDAAREVLDPQTFEKIKEKAGLL